MSEEKIEYKKNGYNPDNLDHSTDINRFEINPNNKEALKYCHSLTQSQKDNGYASVTLPIVRNYYTQLKILAYKRQVTIRSLIQNAIRIYLETTPDRIKGYQDK